MLNALMCWKCYRLITLEEGNLRIWINLINFLLKIDFKKEVVCMKAFLTCSVTLEKKLPRASACLSIVFFGNYWRCWYLIHSCCYKKMLFITFQTSSCRFDSQQFHVAKILCLSWVMTFKRRLLTFLFHDWSLVWY